MLGLLQDVLGGGQSFELGVEDHGARPDLVRAGRLKT